MRCILSADFIIVMRVGSIARLMISVSSRIDHPQLETMCSCIQCRIRKSGSEMSFIQPKLTIGSMSGPLGLPSAPVALTLLSTSMSLGPA